MNAQQVAPFALLLAALTGCPDEMSAPPPVEAPERLLPASVVEGGEIVGALAIAGGFVVARFDADGLWLTSRGSTVGSTWTFRVAARRPGDERDLRAVQLALTASGKIVVSLPSARGVSLRVLDHDGRVSAVHDDLADGSSPYQLLGTTTHGEDVFLVVSWHDELGVEQVGRLDVPPAGEPTRLQITQHTLGETPDLTFGATTYGALSNGRVVAQSVLSSEAQRFINVYDHTTEHPLFITPVRGPGSRADVLTDDDTHVLVATTASNGAKQLLRYADSDEPILQVRLPEGTQAVTQVGERWIAIAMGEGATPGQLDWLVYVVGSGSYVRADADLGPVDGMDVTGALRVGDEGFAVYGTTGVYEFEAL